MGIFSRRKSSAKEVVEEKPEVETKKKSEKGQKMGTGVKLDKDFGTLDEFLESVKEKNPNEPNFLQAVEEFVESVWEYVQENQQFLEKNILSRIVEPERVVMFRVPWIDDQGNILVNRGFRVQFSSTLGPYKGGLRFHPTVNLDVLKFLGFEQCFKNALTMLPLGGGKGGSDFDPKGKSDNEIMRFCQSFATELQRHVGPSVDVPAGDIGVGGHEIGYIFGQYKRIRDEFTGTFTGKSLLFGGSNLRVEATGYGVVYFITEMLKTAAESQEKNRGKASVEGKVCTISGSGNVAQHAAEKLIELGAKVVTLSDSGGAIYDEEGIDHEKLEYVKDLKNNRRGRIKEYVEKFPQAKYLEGERPWSVPCDIAIPAATQNELDEEDAKQLVENGVMLVCEAANMPSTAGAVKIFQKEKVLFGPAKAANAGGVATSGLEMAQNSMRLSWTREEVDQKLSEIMKNIHQTCVVYGTEDDGWVNYVKGANIGSFRRIGQAMIEQGAV